MPTQPKVNTIGSLIFIRFTQSHDAEQVVVINKPAEAGLLIT